MDLYSLFFLVDFLSFICLSAICGQYLAKPQAKDRLWFLMQVRELFFRLKKGGSPFTTLEEIAPYMHRALVYWWSFFVLPFSIVIFWVIFMDRVRLRF